jgi:hypothetical protein
MFRSRRRTAVRAPRTPLLLAVASVAFSLGLLLTVLVTLRVSS